MRHAREIIRLKFSCVSTHEIARRLGMAAREQRSVRSASMLLSLALLAPNLVKAIVEHRLPRGIGLTRMMDLPADWAEQHLGARPASELRLARIKIARLYDS